MLKVQVLCDSLQGVKKNDLCTCVFSNMEHVRNSLSIIAYPIFTMNGSRDVRSIGSRSTNFTLNLGTFEVF